MTELLAPGVYALETSFRAKPLEGVSTTTAAFFGPTRRGPVSSEMGSEEGELPEILTSIGDFERIYGGTADIRHTNGRTLNYIAHAVRAYFDNGGQRLYVFRLFERDAADVGIAFSDPVATGGNGGSARFVARFPGTYGNGSVSIAAATSRASQPSLEAALNGTMIRTGGVDQQLATPAIALGGRGPFALDDGAELRLGGTSNTSIVFRGTRATMTGQTALADPVPLDDTNNVLTFVVDGEEQTITLPIGEPRQNVLNALSRELRGASVELLGDLLQISSQTQGHSSEIGIRGGSVPLGFQVVAPAVDFIVTNGPDANNNVADLRNVTVDEVRERLQQEANNVYRVDTDLTGRLRIRTTATGADQVISRGAGDTAAPFLGLTDFESGRDGASPNYYIKRAGVFSDSAGGALPANPTGGAEFLTMNILVRDEDGSEQAFENVAFDPLHPRFIGSVLAETPSRSIDRLENGFAFEVRPQPNSVTGFEIRDGLLGTEPDNRVELTRGSDGPAPLFERYGQALALSNTRDDISTVAAPGASRRSDYRQIFGRINVHVNPPRRAYRMAVLDVPPGGGISGMREERSFMDSSHLALYGPWLHVANPDQRPGNEVIPKEIMVPPSGFICGIYARNDILHGVFKAPANESVRGVLRLEQNINLGQQEVLNPEGINVIRFFSGRGLRLWGARLASSDPEWNYVNLRRYFNYIKATIDRGTQWAVFEPNGPDLWRRIRNTITNFLIAERQSGALLGSREEAFFVRCDRSTMTQRDLDTGRLVCEIGLAVVRPAEFVVFKIGQTTGQQPRS